MCKSSTRFRYVGFAVSKYILGGSGLLAEDVDNGASGIGLSDASPLANALKRFKYYRNTFLHKSPKLDIMEPPKKRGLFDFIISSDVFEHTPPPIERPFETAFSLLRDGGTFVLSVPTHIEFHEHFPDLFDYSLEQSGSIFKLVNTTKAGKRQEFHDLRFHGGPGDTLEMRVFSETVALTLMEEAGFSDIECIPPHQAEFGVFPLNGLSTLWVARKT
jgi:SAM-dependent methyltransferase